MDLATGLLELKERTLTEISGWKPLILAEE
jgi:hypothetical protein